MKAVLSAATLFAIAVLAAGPASADAVDDYVACLVGHSAVLMDGQKTKDASTALEKAFGLCKEPADADYGDAEPDGVSDYVNLLVENIAEGMTPHAEPAEDFKACLIGYSVMALDDGVKNASEAQQQASAHCLLPDDPNDEIDVDAIGDHVHELVEKIARL